MRKIIFLSILVSFLGTNLYVKAQSTIADLKKLFIDKNLVIKETTGFTVITETYKHIFVCESGYFYMMTSSTQDFGFDQLDSKKMSMGSWDIIYSDSSTYLKLSSKKSEDYDLLQITHDENKNILLNGDVVNFNEMNSCFTKYSDNDYRQFFNQGSFSLELISGKERLLFFLKVCESGICEIEEDVLDPNTDMFIITSSRKYFGNWDIKNSDGKVFFYWQEKNTNKTYRVELVIFFNQIIFLNYTFLPYPFYLKDPTICNDILQRYNATK